MKPERIQYRIQQLAGWHLDASEAGLAKHYRFPTRRVVLAFVTFADQLARAMSLEPSFEIEARSVWIRLGSSSDKLTDLEFDYASTLDGGSNESQRQRSGA